MPQFFTANLQHFAFNIACANTCRDSWELVAMFCQSDGGNGGGKGAMYPDRFYGSWQEGPSNFHKGV